jgi:hypothetical protein
MVNTIQEVGVDWITATAAAGPNSVGLTAQAETIVDQLAADGYKRRPWAHWGFVGESARFASFGHRADDTCVVLSGWVADGFFEPICRWATSISRLDIQVTVKTDPPLEGVARKNYAEFIRSGPGGRQGATASIIESSDGSSTAYLGRRISAKWLRIYDKQRESGEDQYAGCWRYELELKNDAAMACARYLLASDDRRRDVGATLYRHCTTHGAQPIYSPNGEGLYLLAPRPFTDFAQRCDWLAKSVAGAAQEVSAAIGPVALLGILGVDVDGTGPIVDHGSSPHGHHGYEDGPEI